MKEEVKRMSLFVKEEQERQKKFSFLAIYLNNLATF